MALQGNRHHHPRCGNSSKVRFDLDPVVVPYVGDRSLHLGTGWTRFVPTRCSMGDDAGHFTVDDVRSGLID